MKKMVLIFIVIFLSLQIFSQSEYLPLVSENKYWVLLEFEESAVAPGALGGYVFAISGDTVVNDITYQKVYKHTLAGNHPCQYPPCFEFEIPYQITGTELVSLIREDTMNKKIFNLPAGNGEFCDIEEHLLFDFSLTNGDSLNDCAAQAITFGGQYGIIDSITSESIYDKQRRTLYTTGIMTYLGLPPIGEVKIAEGVGFVTHGLFHYAGNRFEMVDFCEGSLEECNFATGNSDIDSPQNVKVYPNPVTDILVIEADFQIRQVQVYNHQGQFLFQTQSKHLDLSNRTSGMTYINIMDIDGKVYIRKVVVD
jgi:hypothetical protein